jgi:hypothetical protein
MTDSIKKEKKRKKEGRKKGMHTGYATQLASSRDHVAPCAHGMSESNQGRSHTLPSE